MKKTLFAPSKRTILQVLLMSLLIFIMYFPVLKAGYIWDDDAYVANNLNLQSAQGFRRIWLEPRTSPQYYPLVFSSFWIERQLFGPGPFVSHLINICLHVLNALLLWSVLRRLGVAAAFFIALVFGLHPVHLESVAWITERKNVLSALFYFLAMRVYLSYALPQKIAASRTRLRSLVRYLTGILLFICALLSKSVTATLPMILLSILWWKKEKLTRWDWLALCPLFIIGAAFGLSTAWLEMRHVGASGAEWGLSLAGRFLVAGRAAWFYAGKLVWPQPLSFIYFRWAINPGDILQFLYPLSLLACCLALWFCREKAGKGPLVAAFFFLCTLFPALGFLNVYPMRYSYVADHFQYLASIGIIALVILFFRKAWNKLNGRGFRYASMALLVLLLIAVGRREAGKYRDLETLWEDTISKNSDCWMAYNNLGTLRIEQNRYAEARACFREALKRKSDLAEAENNLGVAWMKEGDLGKAKERFAKAIAMDPGYAEAYNNLGVAQGREQRFAEAARNYELAIHADPEYVMAHYNLANILSRNNELKDAETHYREAIRLRPDFAMAYYYHGLGLLKQGRTEEARQDLATAFRLKPGFSLGYLQAGNVFLEQGRIPEAIVHYREALRIQPEYPVAENNLGFALERAGRREEAILHYRRALSMAPRYQKAKENLERAMQSK
jgi:tetratricopeptide (TPR) repeat protein